MTETRDPFIMPISKEIWEMKYQYKLGNTIYDKTVHDTWRRVAKHLASVENNPDEWEEEFYNTLKDFKYIPAGRILAGAGTGRDVTLFNCFVMGTVPDTLEGIFEMLKEAALTMKQGGGIGYDFSTIRPKGELVHGVGSDASGPLTFMDVWDTMCNTIMSAGTRRGAMMATMRCDHPDIEDFIEAKRDPRRLRRFNVSVLATDAFMEAVKADKEWELVWNGRVKKVVKARDLWDKIMKSTYEYAEPGVIFIDRINEMNPLGYIETIAATNPCGEQPLPPYGACLLGSVNLVKFIDMPFTDEAYVDYESLRDTVFNAVRMMDNVVDASKYPLDQQAQEAHAKRRIGLGVTGLADALIMLKMKYGSKEAVAKTEEIMEFVNETAYEASIILAKEKGPFPLYDADGYVKSPFIQQLPAWMLDELKKHGIRNALLTSIAPTGTISLQANNVTSGIEPAFAFEYNRKVTQPDGTRTEQKVMDYAVKLYRDMYPEEENLPDYFVSAMDGVTPEQHVRMQAAAQKHVDSSISKTINVPKDISFEDFKDVYMLAYDLGCKGCTTYRPNDITGSMLSVDEEKPKQEEKKETFELLDRYDVLDGKTYKIKVPDMPHAFYITLNDIEVDGVKRPFEIFIQTQNIEAQAWISALTRMISAVFRRGGDVSFVAKELKQIHDPRGGFWSSGKYLPSLVAAIGSIIEEHMGLTKGQEPARQTGKQCKTCGEFTVVVEQGCEKCLSCGDSKCG